MRDRDKERGRERRERMRGKVEEEEEAGVELKARLTQFVRGVVVNGGDLEAER